MKTAIARGLGAGSAGSGCAMIAGADPFPFCKAGRWRFYDSGRSDLDVVPLKDVLLVLAGGIAALAGHIVTMFNARATRRQAFQLAALERRLDAHQRAYTLWWRLMGSLSRPEELQQSHLAAQNWWQENCLFLDRDSRKAYREALIDAAVYPMLDAVQRKELRKQFNRVLELLEEGVGLPALGANEFIEKQEGAKKGVI